MSRARSAVIVLLVSFVVVCCSSPPSPASHTLAAKNYARDCASVADCFAVYEGFVDCCGGGCPNTAIRDDALPKYMSDFKAANHCDAPAPCRLTILPCNEGRVACVAGVCEFETPPPDGDAAD